MDFEQEMKDFRAELEDEACEAIEKVMETISHLPQTTQFLILSSILQTCLKDVPHPLANVTVQFLNNIDKTVMKIINIQEKKRLTGEFN